MRQGFYRAHFDKFVISAAVVGIDILFCHHKFAGQPGENDVYIFAALIRKNSVTLGIRNMQPNILCILPAVMVLIIK